MAQTCLGCGRPTMSVYGVCSKPSCTRTRNLKRGLIVTDRVERHCLGCNKPTLALMQVCSSEQCRPVKKRVERSSAHTKTRLAKGTEHWACLSCRAPTASWSCVCNALECRWLDRGVRKMISSLAANATRVA
jgi:hypothetical protein